MSRLIRAINLAVTRGFCCSLPAMAVLGISVLMPDKCIAVCRERIVQWSSIREGIDKRRLGGLCR